MKRFRYKGKAMSKYDMCWLMEFVFHYRNLSWISMSDAFSYSEIVVFFNKCILFNS